MENKINQIVVLSDGTKYFILNQAIYQEKNYFLATKVTENEKSFVGEITILEQNYKEKEEYLSIVVNREILDILVKYLKPKEEGEK